MNFIAWLDLTSAVAFIAATVCAFRIRKDVLGQSSRFFLVLLLLIYVLVGISNVLEHSGITDIFDPYEDYLEVLFVAVFLFFMYTTKIFSEIEDRKKTEQALRQSEKRYKTLYQHTPIMLHSIDHQGCISNVNDRWLQTLGYAREEVIGRKSTDFLTNDSRRKAKETFPPDLLRTGAAREIPCQMIKKNGQSIDVLLTASSDKDDDGQVVGQLAVIEDITDRKQAEEALRESEERFRILFEYAPDAYFLVSPEGEFIDGNKAAEKLSGYLKEELIGKNFYETAMISSGQIDKAAAMLLSNAQGLPEGPEEFVLTRKDGSTVIVELSNYPAKLQNEMIILGIARDITDRKQTEETFRKEKEKFQILVEASPLAVSFISKDDTYEYINPKFKEMFGYTLEDLSAGREWFTQAYPDRDYRRHVVSAWKNDFINSKPGETRPRIFTVTCKDGSEKIIHFRPVAMETGDHLVIYENITERKQLELQLQQAQKMEAIGTLAGGIAHDFNNILTPLIIHTELALMEIPEESPANASLQEVLKSSDRARNLVNQILTFSRQTDQTQRPLKASLIVKEALKLLRSTLPTTIEIRQKIESESDMILADPTQIHQVLMNLCTNAYHAMRDIGGTLSVSLSDQELDSETARQLHPVTPGSYLKIAVKDTGHGIDPTVLDKIFQPYFTTKGKGVGTGLGLAVVHGIIKNLGGLIDVHSEKETGTTFEILLPKVELSTKDKAVLDKPIPTGDEHILFVDDEDVLVEAGNDMLKRLGYRVTSATSSLEALEIFRDQPDSFDLVITDQTMPNMTGAALSQEIKNIREDVPIILCTGFSEIINEEKAKKLGLDAFVLKPIILRDMANTIRQILDLKTPAAIE
jgi:PAS domain S-box-containing protein